MLKWYNSVELQQQAANSLRRNRNIYSISRALVCPSDRLTRKAIYFNCFFRLLLSLGTIVGGAFFCSWFAFVLVSRSARSTCTVYLYFCANDAFKFHCFHHVLDNLFFPRQLYLVSSTLRCSFSYRRTDHVLTRQ